MHHMTNSLAQENPTFIKNSGNVINYGIDLSYNKGEKILIITIQYTKTKANSVEELQKYYHDRNAYGARTVLPNRQAITDTR